MAARRFVATTEHITIAAGAYQPIVPEGVAALKRPY